MSAPSHNVYETGHSWPTCWCGEDHSQESWVTGEGSVYGYPRPEGLTLIAAAWGPIRDGPRSPDAFPAPGAARLPARPAAAPRGRYTIRTALSRLQRLCRNVLRGLLAGGSPHWR